MKHLPAESSLPSIRETNLLSLRSIIVFSLVLFVMAAGGLWFYRLQERSLFVLVLMLFLAVSFVVMTASIYIGYLRNWTQHQKLTLMEPAFRASQKRLQRFYESGLIGIVYWDMKGRIIDANDKFLEMTGYSRDDLVQGGIDWLKMTPPEYRYLDQASVREMNATGVYKTPFEKEYFRKDGTRLPIIVAGAMLDEELHNGVAFVLDKSQNKRDETALRESELRYRLLFENMLHGYAYCRMLYDHETPVDFIYEDVNPAYVRLTGMKDVIGRKASEVIPGFRESHPGLIESYGRVVMTGKPEKFESQLGQPGVWYEVSVFSPGQELFAIIIDNITARKNAAVDLATQVRQRQQALDAAQLGWWIYDPVTKISSWDERHKEIFGVSGEQPENGEILALQHPDDRMKVREAIEAALTPGSSRPYSIEYRINRPDGTMRWVEAHGVAAFEGEGATAHATNFVGTVQDITERKRSVELLKQSMDNLERSNKELEQFAYVASHDLQEPLRMIASFLQLLDQTEGARLRGESREFIDFALKGAVRMQNLINDLLTYSRVQSRNTLTAPVDLHGAFGEAIANLYAAMKETDAVVIAGELPTVLADANQMTQLFQNLIGNALKFRGEEAPRVSIGARRQAEEWVFSVKDNGIGIESQYFEKIFQIFQRLHTRDKYPGTGIGLPLCKHIVESNGGRIWLESTPGKGTTFYFTLPASLRNDREAA